MLLYFVKESKQYHLDHSCTLVRLVLVFISKISDGKREINLEMETYLFFYYFPMPDFQYAVYSKNNKDIDLRILQDAIHQIL